MVVKYIYAEERYPFLTLHDYPAWGGHTSVEIPAEKLAWVEAAMQEFDKAQDYLDSLEP